MLADGGETITDLAVLRDQAEPLTPHDPKDPGEPDHRAGTPPWPNAEITSTTRQ